MLTLILEHPLVSAGLVMVGVIFSESIRAFIRKVTKGRFFGATPAASSK